MIVEIIRIREANGHNGEENVTIQCSVYGANMGRHIQCVSSKRRVLPFRRIPN